MLADARSLWDAATNVVATINGNVTTALEHFEQENFPEARDGNAAKLQEIRSELDEYKRLLDDAQLQHFELSKVSRLLVAEKDAELSYFRKKYAEQEGNNAGASETVGKEKNIDLEYEKLLNEKNVLELSIDDLQQQLRDSLHEQNEHKVLKRSHEGLLVRFDSIKKDFSSLKTEMERKDKQKGETIENLVQEYSKLAAEAELSQSMSTKRVAEVLRDNEVLITKMHALEHSLTELADRSASNSSSSSSNSSTHMATAAALAALPVGVPITSASAATSGDSTPTQASDATQAASVNVINAGMEMELKEARAKLVNLQFDVKMKEDEVAKIKAMYLAATSAQSSSSTLPSPLPPLATGAAEGDTSVEIQNLKLQLTEEVNKRSELEKTIDRLEKDTENSSQDCARLTVEKRDAENAGKAYLEQCKKLRLEVEELKTQHKKELQSREEALQAKQQEQQHALEQEGSTAASAISAAQERIVELEAQLAEQSKTHADAVVKAAEELSQVQQAVEEDKATQQSLHAKEIETLSASLTAAKDTEIARVKEDAEARLLAATTGNDSAKETLIAEYSAKISALTEQVAELERTKAELAELRVTLEKASVDRDAAQERITALEAAEVELKASSAQAKDQALAELREQLTTQHQTEQIEAVTAAVGKAISEAAEKQDAAVSALRTEHTAKLEKLTEALNASAEKAKNEALATLSAEKTKEKDDAITQQVKQHQEVLDTALQTLTQQKDSERVKAESDLRQLKEQEMATALAAAASNAAEELKAAEEAAAQRIAQIQAEVESVKQELLVVEEKHAKIKAEALEALGQQKDAEKQTALDALRADMQGLVEAANAERDEHLANYTKERKLRKKVHNKLLELQGNIRVLCRVRPVLDVERRSGEDVDVTEIPAEDEIILQRDAHTHRTRYEYDRVFGQQSSQQEVFEAVQPLCVSVLDGYNVCIFAYGQTGSGKTYTMEGYGDNVGVTPRAISELLNQVQQLAETATYRLTMSMLEIYNETILDLLGPANTKVKLDIRQTAEGNQVVGLSEIEITSMDQVKDIMKRGQANRAVGSHDMNEHSSRSHSILTVVCRGKNHLDGSTTYGKLHLIDLAGSERISKTDATGDRLKEAQNINKSLSALGDVINALGNKKSMHVPYRNSKLTFLLQDSLGGNSKVLTFVNISPAVYNLGETVCSLNFATRCRSTELGQAKKQSVAGGSERVERRGSATALSGTGGSTSNLSSPMNAGSSSRK